MQLKLYNTLTKNKEIFTPLKQSNVKLYVCGPTIYDYIHIGNARSLIVFDILFRTLRLLYGSNNVVYVRNITDIDDKINDRAKQLGISINILTAKTSKDFHEDAKYLNCLIPTYEPKALDHIKEMIDIISMLLEKKIAYISDNHVYFDVSLYKDYYELSKKNIDENIAGVRIDVSESKENPNDFVLWKPSLESDDSSSIFESPWGRGRPGWHIECSAMSHKYLGENFDIHGGGIDLIFPHHTNEIAQSRSAFPNSSHSKYWIHNGFLTVDGQKMSKSLGNFITVQNIRDKNISGEILRFALMHTHYRKPLNYSEQSLKDAEENLDYFYRSIKILPQKDDIIDLPEEFLKAIKEDLNINEAIAFMHAICKNINKENDVNRQVMLARQLKSCGNFLGILEQHPDNLHENYKMDDEVQTLVNQRAQYKKDKKWEEADKIRDLLMKENIIITDRPDGTSYIIKKDVKLDI
jgi:cysteinyl-tRNA synthetase